MGLEMTKEAIARETDGFCETKAKKVLMSFLINFHRVRGN